VDDPQLRRALKWKVLSAHADDPNTRVIDELGLEHGTSRIDVAVVNGILHGFEIKSDRDTLSRLSGQMAVYNAVLDRVTLVVGQRHATAAAVMIPGWWGVKVADVGPRGAIRFRTLQRGRLNPKIDPLAVARLLWKDEAINLLEQFGSARGVSGMPRAKVYELVVEAVPLGSLRSYVRDRLRRRIDWRSE
jgi:hypothetical protein